MFRKQFEYLKVGDKLLHIKTNVTWQIIRTHKSRNSAHDEMTMQFAEVTIKDDKSNLTATILPSNLDEWVYTSLKVGDRVERSNINCNESYVAGMLGTVREITDNGVIWVLWDIDKNEKNKNGCTYGSPDNSIPKELKLYVPLPSRQYLRFGDRVERTNYSFGGGSFGMVRPGDKGIVDYVTRDNTISVKWEGLDHSINYFPLPKGLIPPELKLILNEDKNGNKEITKQPETGNSEVSGIEVQGLPPQISRGERRTGTAIYSRRKTVTIAVGHLSNRTITSREKAPS